jgi:peptidyl-prolyl cis-trans isomerase SurA
VFFAHRMQFQFFKFGSFFLSLLALMLMLTASPLTQAKPPASQDATTHTLSYVMAVVNTEPITWGEVQAREQLLLQKQSIALSSRSSAYASTYASSGSSEPARSATPPRLSKPSKPSKFSTPSDEAHDRDHWQSQALEDLIEETAVWQWAKTKNMEIEETTIDGAIEEAAMRAHLSLSAWHTRLKAAGVSLPQYRKDLERTLLWERLREREIEPTIRVQEADIDTFLSQQLGVQAFAQPRVRWGHVLFSVPDNASAEEIHQQEMAAQTLAMKARAGLGDLRSLASTEERAGSRPEERYQTMAGRRVDQYPSLFTGALLHAPIKQVKGPMRSPAGFHVLEVLERLPSPLPLLQTHVRHILLTSLNPQGLPTQIQKLTQLRQTLLRGQASFEELAQKWSEDGSAQNGGDLGWSLPGQFVPPFEEAMNQLKPGEISSPVVSEFGVHLIEVLERQPSTMPMKAQRQWIKQALVRAKSQEAFQAWRQEIRRGASVVYPQGRD